MCDGTETGQPMSDAVNTDAEAANAGEGERVEEKSEQGEKLVPQSEVDRIVKERAERIAKQRFADYDELKAKAEGSKTLEERLASLEGELTTARSEALKASIAAKFGISTEPGADGSPSDADLFLTGTDSDSLTRQAQRLAARDADRKKQGNVAPKEGVATKPSGTADIREFAKGLFGTAD